MDLLVPPICISHRVSDETAEVLDQWLCTYAAVRARDRQRIRLLKRACRKLARERDACADALDAFMRTQEALDDIGESLTELANAATDALERNS